MPVKKDRSQKESKKFEAVGNMKDSQRLGRSEDVKVMSRLYHEEIFSSLERADVEVYDLIGREFSRRAGSLQLVAAENDCSRAVLAALGSVMQNKTAEGVAGSRLHSGCEVVDEAEELAVERAKAAFGAEYANVQPHSGTSANLIALTAVLEQGARILSLPTEQGGHFSHGCKESITGRMFEIGNYYLDKESLRLDYDAIAAKAEEFSPKLIICGASVYSRAIDFGKFREIADSVGAYLLADISHISALVIGGVHQSPIDYAHFVTSSTYKPGGPRGGLILMGKDKDLEVTVRGQKLSLQKLIEQSTFPGRQGTAHLNNIAGKAVFCKEAQSQEYKDRQFKVVENAKVLAASLSDLGYDVLTGGTDNHMVLVDTVKSRDGLDGVTASRALEECGIVVDAIEIPYQEGKRPAGIRLGTPIVTKRGMRADEMKRCAGFVDEVFENLEIIDSGRFELKEEFKKEIRGRVAALCGRFGSG